MLRAVFFDLDGTLYDRDLLVADLFEAQYEAFAHALRGLRREQFLHDAHAMDDHGYGVKETGYRELVRSWGVEDAIAQQLVRHFWEYYDEYCRLPDEVRCTLDELRAQHYKVGLVTNGGSVRQRRKISVLGLDNTFDTVLVSEDEGVRKPDAEIFRRALQRCAVDASESMFVGDHPVADVQGAHRAGMIAVWKHVPYWKAVVSDAPTIRRLSDVLALCAAIKTKDRP